MRTYGREQRTEINAAVPDMLSDASLRLPPGSPGTITAVLDAADRFAAGSPLAGELAAAGPFLPHALPALCRALRNSSPAVRAEAVRLCGAAIGELQSSALQIAPIACAALGSPWQAVQRYGCNLLGQIGGLASLPDQALLALAELLQERHWDAVRTDAAHALAAARAVKMLPVMAASTVSECGTGVVHAVARLDRAATEMERFGGIGDLFVEAERQAAEDGRRFERRLAALRGTEALPGAAESWMSWSNTYRQMHLLPAAIAAMAEPHARVRALGAETLCWAARSLGTRDQELIPAVLTMLGDVQSDIRAAACEAAGRMRLRAAVPALRAELFRGDARTAQHAAYALARIGDAGALQDLRRCEGQQSAASWRGALDMLQRKLAAGQALWIDLYLPVGEQLRIVQQDAQALRGGVTDGRWRLMRAGLLAMHALPDICCALHNPDERSALAAGRTAVEAAVRMREEAALTVPLLLGAMKDPSGSVSSRAVEILHGLGAERLHALLRDPVEKLMEHE